jgi:hypothetical protein
MKKYLFFFSFILLIVSCQKDGSELSSSDGGSNTGIGGSMAKFAFYNQYLYVVEKQYLQVYDVSVASKPLFLRTIDLNNTAVETIFPYGEYLFFGTQNGMLIYSLSNPSTPNYISTYSHIVSCDPVVVQDNIAYVTLSTGNQCGRGVNQLELIDISNIYNPQLLKVYNFNNPKGLSIDGNYLYLCDGNAGLKVIDVTDIYDARVVETFTGIDAYDVIKNSNSLTVTGKDGVYQLDCTNPLDLKLISKIGKN